MPSIILAIPNIKGKTNIDTIPETKLAIEHALFILLYLNNTRTVGNCQQSKTKFLLKFKDIRILYKEIIEWIYQQPLE